MQTNLMQPESSQLLHMNLNCKLEMFYNQKHQQAPYTSSQESRRIKPSQPQDPPPKPPQPPLKPPLPSSYERSSKEVVPFRPSEAFTEQQPVLSNEYGVPVRPPRPPKPKSIQVISSFFNIYLII